MSCTYYEFKSSGWFGGDYWCRKKDCRVDDNTYYKYCRDYNYDECPIYNHTESSGCFLTTMACQILGKDDKNPVLNNLRTFRNEVLQKDKQYYEVLRDYDIIGPMIVDAINNDKDKYLIAETIYNNVILPVNEAINKKNYERAIKHYQYMTIYLIVYYGLNNEYNLIKNENYDYQDFNPNLAGHGLKRVKNT